MKPIKKNIWEELRDSCKVEASILQSYSKNFGGIRKIFVSIYFWFSVIFTLICAPFWISGNWWDTTISVLSILIGFTSAGLGTALAVMSDDFKKVLKENHVYEPDKVPYLQLIAGLLHYILVCFIAIGVALFSKAWIENTPAFLTNLAISSIEMTSCFMVTKSLLGAFGFLLFSYGIFSCLHCSILIYQLAKHDHEWVEKQKED